MLYSRTLFIHPTHCSLHPRRQWRPTPVLLPGKSHGWRSLVGCSPRGRYESDTTEQLHFPFSLSCIGQGNGNPLQCSCPENPRDGGAWWAAVYGVAQSQTQLERLSSSILTITCSYHSRLSDTISHTMGHLLRETIKKSSVYCKLHYYFRRVQFRMSVSLNTEEA